MAGSMTSMQRSQRERVDPGLLLPGAGTAVVAVASYSNDRAPAPAPSAGHGVVARYARGEDYHLALRRDLERLADQIQQFTGDAALQYRIAVDSTPLLERELAMAAGVGFIGKNCMLITPGVGSFTVLGVLLLRQRLTPDAPATPRCGRCTRCIDACPTSALRAPRVLDARRCISCLTIEHRGPVPTQLRASIAPWVFGCDACQEACPYNRAAPARAPAHPALLPDDAGAAALPLDWLLRLGAGDYRRLRRGRALGRAPQWQWVRNAALAAATPQNLAQPAILAALEHAAAHPHAEVQDAARWALGRRAARG